MGKVLADLVKLKRLKSRRKDHPSQLIIDVQSVKTSENSAVLMEEKR
jgi:hypothetical protein